MKKKKKHYRVILTTRKDFSFLLLLILLIGFFLPFFIAFMKFAKYFEAVVALIFIFIFISLLFNNKIILEKYYLRINFGIFTRKIKYKDIKALYIIDNHFMGFVSSYHKVGIKTSNHQSFIFDTFLTPFDREGFIEKVFERCNF